MVFDLCAQGLDTFLHNRSRGRRTRSLYLLLPSLDSSWSEIGQNSLTR